MENTDYIENYFKGNNSDEQKSQFEKKILEDKLFAGEVAFYISANDLVKQQLAEEKKQRFREMYEQQKVTSIKQPVKYLWRYMAAASVIVAVSVLIWLLSGDRTSPHQLADKYIQQNFESLGVTMGTEDSLQKGLDLFNSGKLTEALTLFETVAKKDSVNSYAKTYAGITCLRLKNYDKALSYFSMIEAENSYSNWGKFYKAITLLERDKAGDKDAAKLLLQKVTDNNLEGKNEAAEWLKSCKTYATNHFCVPNDDKAMPLINSKFTTKKYTK